MKKHIAIHSIIFKWKSKVFLNLKKISILFLFVISFLSMASAQTETDSLEALLPGLQGREKIEVLEQLIELSTNQVPGKAIEFGRQALELLKHSEDSKMEIKILNKMCSAYMRMGKDSTAIKLGYKSLELAEKVNDRNGQAGALNEIGNMYAEAGEFSLSQAYVAAKVAEGLSDLAEDFQYDKLLALIQQGEV